MRVLPILLWLLMGSISTQAASVTMQFSGVVTGSGLTQISNGTTLSGTYVFEATQPDLRPGNSNLGSYNFVNGSVSVGGFSFTMAPADHPSFPVGPVGSILVDTGSFPTIAETYDVASTLTGDPVGGYTASSLRFGVFSTPEYLAPLCLPVGGCLPGRPRVFDSDALPLDELPINRFEDNFFSLLFVMDVNGQTSNLQVTGDLTSIAPVANVPIPAAAWLFGSALLGLGAVKRRRF